MNPDEFRESSAGRMVRSMDGGYWAFVPHPLPPQLDWGPQLATALSDADRALGELAGVGRSIANPQLLIRPFVRREAVLSSRIEGTQASLSDLYAYEARQLALFERTSDVQEVHNYVQALEYGLERLGTLPVSLRLVREVHARLMAGVRGERQTPGEFRRRQNWIGPRGCRAADATFVPPPVAEMQVALKDLERYLNETPQLPLVRLGLIHYQFEAIHPFLDGNGRIGRLLMTLLSCAWDLLPQPLLYLSAYLSERRERYYELLLDVSRKGHWEAWLVFFLEGVALQAHDAVVRAGRLRELRERYREAFQVTRAAAGMLQVVDLLFERPLLNARQVETALGVTYQTAQRYIARLESAGVLREVTGNARNRVYRADAVLAAIEEPLDSENVGAGIP